MATGLEILLSGTALSVFGSPVIMGIIFFLFFVGFMIFGRLTVAAGTPLRVAAAIISFEFIPQFKIPFAIVTAIIVAVGFYRIYRGG